MSLKSLFRRKPAPTPTADTAPAPVALAAPVPDSPEALAELRAAWDDLEAACKEAGANRIQACSLSTTPWQKDPAAVRTIAEIIRGVPERTEERTDS